MYKPHYWSGHNSRIKTSLLYYTVLYFTILYYQRVVAECANYYTVQCALKYKRISRVNIIILFDHVSQVLLAGNWRACLPRSLSAGQQVLVCACVVMDAEQDLRELQRQYLDFLDDNVRMARGAETLQLLHGPSLGEKSGEAHSAGT